MKKLSNQDIRDIIYGCSILGTGGGGSLENGLAMVEKDIAEGRELYLADLEDLPDDRYIATPYECGAPSLNGAGEKEEFQGLPLAKEAPSAIAFKSLEEYLGTKFFAVSSTELGGENTAEALHTASMLGIPLMDGDPAGRSVPELQHSSYFVKGQPICPMAVATHFGEVVILKNACGDIRAEEIVRSIAVASGDLVGVADHPLMGKEYKESIIPGAISYAMELGKTLRESRESNKDIAAEIAAKGKGKILFRGTLKSAPWKSEGGFNYGDIYLDGIKEYVGHEYHIYFKNENMYSCLDGTLDVSVPDLICMIDEDGNPITTPNFRDNMEMNIIVLPAPEVWKSKRGLEVFGPRSFGFDFDYVPFDMK